jgi:hypothetical protein
MVDTVIRVYDSRSRAESAVAALREAGFTDSQVLGATATDEPDRAAFVTALRQADLGAKAADFYADRLTQGAALVLVKPSFGLAGRASRILDQHSPVPVELPAEIAAASTPAGQRGGQLSPTPFSDWLGWPTLTRKKFQLTPETDDDSSPPRQFYTERWFGLGLLSRQATPFSKRFGWGLLSSKPTPFSSRMGWKVLSSEATPFSSRFGWKLLSDNRTPFSSRVGWRLLSDNRTPLSSRFGWPLLTSNRTPFSTWMGWKLPGDKPS